jgi:hypothetical protein
VKVSLSIEYSADADRPGETAEDEQATLDAVQEAVDAFREAIERACAARGLTT